MAFKPRVSERKPELSRGKKRPRIGRDLCLEIRVTRTKQRSSFVEQFGYTFSSLAHRYLLVASFGKQRVRTAWKVGSGGARFISFLSLLVTNCERGILIMLCSLSTMIG